jgi:polyisoprenoid-binding protein YceI
MTAVQPKTTTWKLDAAHTQVEFQVKHMMFSTVKGRFDKFDGTIYLDEQDFLKSSAEAEIDVDSITTGDATRDNHLRTADFFLLEEHPKLTFKSTSIEAAGKDKYKVYGDLTIRGITKQVVLDTEYEGRGANPWGKEVVAFSATTSINRKDYGLNWNVALETGGVLVSENVKINIYVQAVQA